MWIEHQLAELSQDPLCPVYVCIDMVCAAKFVQDAQWYRAQVTDLPGSRMAEVFFVDFGNTSMMPHWELKKLKDQFLKLPIQVSLS